MGVRTKKTQVIVMNPLDKDKWNIPKNVEVRYDVNIHEGHFVELKPFKVKKGTVRSWWARFFKALTPSFFKKLINANKTNLPTTPE